MKHILTVATPEASRDDATHMTIVHGWLQSQTPQEWQGAFTAQYQDADGNLYRVFSLPVAQSTIGGMLDLLEMAVLPRPPQDADNLINMAGANRAHDMLRGNVWQVSSTEPTPQVASDKIIAVIGMKGTEALSAMGLTQLPNDDLL